MLGKTARKVSLLHPFLRAPNASKNQDLRAMSPYASRQSTGKMTNRPHFAHVQAVPRTVTFKDLLTPNEFYYENQLLSLN